MWATIFYGIVLVALSVSCTKKSPVRPTENGTRITAERAEEKLLSLLDKNESVRGVASIEFPNGDFAYSKTRIESPGKLGQKLAIYSDGSVVGHAEAKRRFADEYHDRWGKIGRTAAQYLLDVGDRETLFAIWHKPSYADAVEKAAKQLSADVKYQEHLPVVRARLDGAGVRALSRHPGIDRIELLGSTGEIKLASVALPDALSTGYSGALHTFNADGSAAQDVKVGIFEGLYKRPPLAGEPYCELATYHDAFEHASVTYLGSYDPASSPSSCLQHSDCDHCEQYGCFNGKCISKHASWVASRVVNGYDDNGDYDDAALMAGKAHIYVHTDWNRVDFAADTGLFLDVYSDFIDEGVEIVNESQMPCIGLDCGDDPPEYSELDHVRDYVVRWEGIKITKAAGNNTDDNGAFVCSNGVFGDDTTADCHSLNSVCVGALEDEGTGTYADDTVACWSLWKNPKFGGSSTRKEAERPDIATEGASAFVVHAAFTDVWDQLDGTSFAAPVVAGMMALNDELCSPKSPLWYKAVLRTAAYVEMDTVPAGEEVYPIPGFSADSRVGAGLPLAGHFYFPCGETLPEPPEGSEPEDAPFNGGDTLELTVDLDDSTWFTPPQEIYDNADEDDTNPVTQALKHGSGTLFLPLTDEISLSAGTRVRATLAFNTCVKDVATVGTDAAPVRDMDLVLCDLEESTPVCVGVSQSNDDTAEGFYVEVDSALEHLRFYLVQESGQTGVTCKQDPLDPPLFEPMVLSYGYWEP